jgi:hypothetical protein
VGFLYMIFPVPETLKVFFALECVFTFGITNSLRLPCWWIRTGRSLFEPCGLNGRQNYAKIQLLPNFGVKKPYLEPTQVLFAGLMSG